MKLYILSILSLGGALFANSPEDSPQHLLSALTLPEEQADMTSLDPTRGVVSISIDPAVVQIKEFTTLFPFPWIETTLSYRSPIFTFKDSQIGNGHKISCSNPIINMYLWKTFETKGPTSLFSFGYQNLTYLSSKSNSSLYIGAGIFCHTLTGLECSDGKKIRQKTHCPTKNFCLGLEMNRKNSFPIFIEAQFNSISYTNPDTIGSDHVESFTIYLPKIQFGISY